MFRSIGSQTPNRLTKGGPRQYDALRKFGTAFFHKNDRNAAGCFGPLGRRHPTASRRVDLVSTTPFAIKKGVKETDYDGKIK
ncbi:hypothetical protein PRIPAC_80629 [Pristionchus pacificus]|uniref:Uncharacterized protein n=1 Tax=Pristionchus pacificus TaxID=54126 RepID=A0A2A6CL17_PRIPA|nr:hypothetical protein PRIPAC_80629 [Pristionchus pacificus]|eukprot:PDM78925.1 hypothetical protein PRIPAC_31504 [Pristionchus pacificus]